jgi:hypothetical protein
MKKNEFEEKLIIVSKNVIDFCNKFIFQTIPSNYVYRVYPNRSFDKTPRVLDEQLFPDDSRGFGLSKPARIYTDKEQSVCEVAYY